MEYLSKQKAQKWFEQLSQIIDEIDEEVGAHRHHDEDVDSPAIIPGHDEAHQFLFDLSKSLTKSWQALREQSEDMRATKNISGWVIELPKGQTYAICRTMLRSGSRKVTVSIYKLGDRENALWTKSMDYDDANELMWAFDELNLPLCSAREW